MPTVSVSSQVSTAVYFVSIFGLLVLLARPVYLAYSVSQERSAQLVSSGVGATIDSMSPGTSLLVSIDRYPGVEMSISLAGRTVSASFGGAQAAAQVRWDLTSTTMSPGKIYNFTLEGDKVYIAVASHD